MLTVKTRALSVTSRLHPDRRPVATTTGGCSPVQLIALRPDAIAIDIPAEITKDPEEEQSDEGKELDQDNRIDGVNEYTYMRLLDERMELAESEAHLTKYIGHQLLLIVLGRPLRYNVKKTGCLTLLSAPDNKRSKAMEIQQRELFNQAPAPNRLTDVQRRVFVYPGCSCQRARYTAITHFWLDRNSEIHCMKANVHDRRNNDFAVNTVIGETELDDVHDCFGQNNGSRGTISRFLDDENNGPKVEEEVLSPSPRGHEVVKYSVSKTVHRSDVRLGSLALQHLRGLRPFTGGEREREGRARLDTVVHFLGLVSWDHADVFEVPWKVRVHSQQLFADVHEKLRGFIFFHTAQSFVIKVH
ncbi:hypothetical protein F2P81_023893 [Scophthalmus maximus]|uniref:Uncharacterized protein n=1 Tax=Scophthalmus maximus TaxID=52904 RepID=A0A6A4RN12_SCOMX|nr:hypothetical protein F2P81_023893 [Scophthalmus maximus]